MAKEISTLGGAFATVGTAILAGVTFGQVKKLNNAVESCAKYTGKSFMETSVRHIGEAAGKGVATAATAVAAGVTFGQVDALNEAVVTCAESTLESSKAAAKATASTLNDAIDGVPVVGHAKGAIHYLVGDESGGEKAMKSASRTVGVIAGGAGGFVLGGPVGAVAGGIAGGAAADGIISGADSAVHKEWRPYGQIAAWDAVANGKTDEEIIDGVIGGLVTPAFDALGGMKAGKNFAPKAAKPPAAPVAKPNLLRPPKANQALKAGKKRPPTAPRGQKTPGTQGSAVGKQNPPVNGKARPSTASTKPQPKPPQPPAPGSRVSAVSENNPSVSGKTRPSTASTRASTAKTSVKSVAAEQNHEGLGGNVEPIPRNPNNALNAFMEQESKPQPKPPQPPAPGSRVSAVTENNPSVNGKTRPSTASTRASTAKTSVKSVAAEQTHEGLGGNVEPIPRNPNNALNAFMEQESKPQPKPRQPPAPANRVSAVSENSPSVNGKTRPSTASTRASTAKTSVKSVAAEQNHEGLGGNVEPIPRNPNNAINAFMEQESKPQPTAPGSRVSAVSENSPSVNGNVRASTASTRASTAKTSVKSVAAEQNHEGLGGNVEPIPRNPNNALNAFMEQESKPQPTAPGSRVSAVSENSPSVNGKTRPSTASTRASTAKTSVKSVAAEQNHEGLGGNVEPIPRNPNNALNTFMEQELTPKQHQPQPPSCVQPQQAEFIVFAAGAPGRGTPHSQARKAASSKKAGKRPGQTGGRGGRGGRGRGREGSGRGSGGPGRPGGPVGAGGSGMGGGPGLSMSHPEGFHQLFGMTDEQFATFEDQGNGTFIATEGFNFVHAVSTTNDHPTTIAINTATEQPVQAGGAGALWQTCTGRPIGSNTCAVSNCTNINRGCSVNPQHAGATAHVYLTSQTPNHQIEYMVLMPTCSGNNNCWQCLNNSTNFPPGGQQANVLQARPGTPVMFIRIDRNTAGRKGDKGKGTGKGGSFGPPFSHDGGDGNNGAAH